jgi:hypothetical protein
VKITRDHERLVSSFPGIFGGGLFWKIVFSIGSFTVEDEEGTSRYPFFLLPHTQITPNSLAVGQSFGLLGFGFSLNLEQKLRRVTIGLLSREEIQKTVKGLATTCVSVLMTLQMF